MCFFLSILSRNFLSTSLHILPHLANDVIHPFLNQSPKGEIRGHAGERLMIFKRNQGSAKMENEEVAV
jgi:hypothetical protein